MEHIEYIQFRDLSIPKEFILTEDFGFSKGTYYKVSINSFGNIEIVYRSYYKSTEVFPLQVDQGMFYYFIKNVKYEPCSFERFLKIKAFM